VPSHKQINKVTIRKVQHCLKEKKCDSHMSPIQMSSEERYLSRHKFKDLLVKSCSMPGRWHSSRICAFLNPSEGSVVINHLCQLSSYHSLSFISLSLNQTVSISINSVQLDACQCFERTNFTNFKTETRV
jgi:hypothetical protein